MRPEDVFNYPHYTMPSADEPTHPVILLCTGGETDPPNRMTYSESTQQTTPAPRTTCFPDVLHIIRGAGIYRHHSQSTNGGRLERKTWKLRDSIRRPAARSAARGTQEICIMGRMIDCMPCVAHHLLRLPVCSPAALGRK